MQNADAHSEHSPACTHCTRGTMHAALLLSLRQCVFGTLCISRQNRTPSNHLVQRQPGTLLSQVKGVPPHEPALQAGCATLARVQQHIAHSAQHAGIPRKEAACTGQSTNTWFSHATLNQILCWPCPENTRLSEACESRCYCCMHSCKSSKGSSATLAIMACAAVMCDLVLRSSCKEPWLNSEIIIREGHSQMSFGWAQYGEEVPGHRDMHAHAGMPAHLCQRSLPGCMPPAGIPGPRWGAAPGYRRSWRGHAHCPRCRCPWQNPQSHHPQRPAFSRGHFLVSIFSICGA